jgi:hypothetical protein
VCWFRLQLPIRCLEELSLSRRLAGLLSGYLPIDTRPQARAKLGDRRVIASNVHAREFDKGAISFDHLLLSARRKASRCEAFLVHYDDH